MVDLRNEDADADDVMDDVDQENDVTDDHDVAGDDGATTATTPSITSTVDDFRQYIRSVIGRFSRQPPHRHHCSNGIIIRTTIRNAMNQMLDSSRNEQDQQRFIECLNMLASEYQGSFLVAFFACCALLRFPHSCTRLNSNVSCSGVY